MPLSWLCVVQPRLCDPQIDLVLGVVNGRKVIAHRSLYEVPQLGHLFVSEDRVIHRGLIAHVRPSLLVLYKRQFLFGQITV